MHYYKHDIGHFALMTAGLDAEEVGIFVRLLDRYLLTEKPIKTEWVNLGFKGETQMKAKAVLSGLFVEKEGGWVYEPGEEMLSEYQKSAEKNRENGKKGGRPRKTSALVSLENPNETEWVSESNPSETESKPKKSLTNNYELITNNQDKKTNKKKISSLVKPDDVSQDIFDEWIDFKKSVSRAKPSQRMIDAIVREAQTAEITTEKAMVLQMENGWQGFKAEYVKKDSGNLFDQQKEVTADTITESQVSFFANKLAYFNPMSKFSRSGESYQQFEKRLATNLRIPENFEKYKPYLVQLGLLKN